MNNILVFDTETSGLPRKDLAYNHPEQARIIQLACLVLDDNFKEVAAFHSLIKPTGWTIHPKAQEAHGISIEQCEKYGIDVQNALGVFLSFNRNVEKRVAHNIKFDSELLNIELHNANNKNYPAILDSALYSFCTMVAMTPVCQLLKVSSIPGSNMKYRQWKWPKLSEAYQHCFGQNLMGAHDAMTDVRATAKIYQWLIENKLV